MWWMGSWIPYSSYYRGDAIWATSIGKVSILLLSLHICLILVKSIPVFSCIIIPSLCCIEKQLLSVIELMASCIPSKKLLLWCSNYDFSLKTSEWFSTVISWATFYCSAAGPHTIISGKDVVNFASANYLGLTGHEKQIVRKSVPLFLYYLWLYFPQIRKCITKFF